MTPISSRPADNWSPLYFLASVGAGGLAVTFFMYLLFWVPHPNATVPVFEDIVAAWGKGNPLQQFGIVAAMLGIAFFAFQNIRYLIWNFSKFAEFKKTEGYRKLRHSNGETQLLAMPLAVAMSINGMFIVGLVFVPNLWSVVEFLFPAAMVAFVLTGLLALRMIGHFLGRVLSEGGLFDVTAHNSFAQLLPAFALAMVAVGLSAPAAMSTSTTVVGASLILSTFFGLIALIYVAVAAVTAFNSMLQYGTAKEAAPTLMIVIPLMTVLGIMTLRQNHGLHAAFEAHSSNIDTLMTLTQFLTVQILFLLLGLTVLRRQGYAATFLTGDKNSAGSYALVCPGVALSVMTQFWLHKGLVAVGLVAKFSVTYWIIVGIALAFQFAMIALVFHLNRRHFAKSVTVAVPAE